VNGKITRYRLTLFLLYSSSLVPSLYPLSKEGAGPFSSIDNSFLTKEESIFFEKLLHGRETDRNKRKNSEIYEFQSIWRPRTASVNGESVIFERRELRKNEVSFALAEINFKTRTSTLYRTISFPERNSLLSNLMQNDTYMEDLILSRPAPTGNSIINDYHSRFFWTMEKNRQNFYGLKIYLEKFVSEVPKRWLLVNYIFDDSIQEPPRVTEIFLFRHQKGFGLKTTRVLRNQQNRLLLLENVFLVNEEFSDDTFIITKENAWEITKNQSSIVYLTEIIKDWTAAGAVEKISEQHFYLSGRISVK